MGWYVVALMEDETIDRVCGSDRQIVWHDLKTLRGVMNRLRGWKESFSKLYTGKNAITRVEIYRFTDSYNTKTYRLMATI